MNAKPRIPSYLFTIALTVCLTLFLTTQPLYAQEEFLPAKAKDISDRAYEKAVIKLLDGAEKSIVISMYNISLGTKKRNPVRLLLEDLLEARQRDVEVTLYLNTRFRDIDKSSRRLIENPTFKRLQEAGCAIHLMPPTSKLHDKLIIIDSRYVVEGSTNWSISALRENLESATLIDSPALAKIKLLRLKNILSLIAEPLTKQPHRALYIENLLENITVPELLLLGEKYFSQMVTKHDSRCMDLYLILLAYSQTIGNREFFIDIEDMALSLGLPSSWSDSALRRQVIKGLKKLKARYNLIRIKFFHSRDAWVELLDLPGDTFTISSKLIKSDSERKLSMRLKFLLIVKALLQARGEDIYSISRRGLAKRFHLHHTTINQAFKELQNWKEEIK